MSANLNNVLPTESTTTAAAAATPATAAAANSTAAAATSTTAAAAVVTTPNIIIDPIEKVLKELLSDISLIRFYGLIAEHSGLANNPKLRFAFCKSVAEIQKWDDAIYELGNCYELGIGTDVDGKQAIECYQRILAKEPDHDEATCGLARCHAKGLGTAKDPKKAWELLNSVYVGSSYGHFQRGVYYEELLEVGEQFIRNALRSYKAACNFGDIKPGRAALDRLEKKRIAICFGNDTEAFIGGSIFGPWRRGQASISSLKSIHNNSITNIDLKLLKDNYLKYMELGVAWGVDTPISTDNDEGYKKRFETLQSKSNRTADENYELAERYLLEGGLENVRKGFECYRLSANGAHVLARMKLGFFHEKGVDQVVKQDHQTALRYFSEATKGVEGKGGEFLAKDYLRICYELGKQPIKDNKELAEYCSQWVTQFAIPAAHYDLGDCHFTGKAGVVNRDSALKNYEIAADAGYQPAIDTLALIQGGNLKKKHAIAQLKILIEQQMGHKAQCLARKAQLENLLREEMPNTDDRHLATVLREVMSNANPLLRKTKEQVEKELKAANQKISECMMQIQKNAKLQQANDSGDSGKVEAVKKEFGPFTEYNTNAMYLSISLEKLQDHRLKSLIFLYDVKFFNHSYCQRALSILEKRLSVIEGNIAILEPALQKTESSLVVRSNISVGLTVIDARSGAGTYSALDMKSVSERFATGANNATGSAATAAMIMPIATTMSAATAAPTAATTASMIAASSTTAPAASAATAATSARKPSDAANELEIQKKWYIDRLVEIKTAKNPENFKLLSDINNSISICTMKILKLLAPTYQVKSVELTDIEKERQEAQQLIDGLQTLQNNRLILIQQLFKKDWKKFYESCVTDAETRLSAMKAPQSDCKHRSESQNTAAASTGSTAAGTATAAAPAVLLQYNAVATAANVASGTTPADAEGKPKPPAA